MKVSAEHQTPTIFRGGGRGVTTCTPLSFSGVAMWHVILCEVPDSPSPHDGAVCTRAHCCTSARRCALTADTDPTLSILVHRVVDGGRERRWRRGTAAAARARSPDISERPCWSLGCSRSDVSLENSSLTSASTCEELASRTWQLLDAGEDAAALYSLCARAHRTISRGELS